ALLDQVEEGQALIPVVLGDRDDEPEVRLDHLLLRVTVAPLDPLGEPDLLRRRQQRVPARLAQEELERVRRRLYRRHDRRGWGRRLGLPVEHLDPALLELAVDAVDLERIERERLQRLAELALPDRARLLRAFEQL